MIYSTATANASYMEIFNKEKNIYEAANKIPTEKILTPFIKYKLEKDIELIDYITTMPENALILSNMGMFLSHISGKIIRDVDFFIGHQDMDDIWEQLQRNQSEIKQNDLKVFVIIVADNSIVRNLEFPEWEMFGNNFEKAFKLIHKKANYAVFMPLL